MHEAPRIRCHHGTLLPLLQFQTARRKTLVRAGKVRLEQRGRGRPAEIQPAAVHARFLVPFQQTGDRLSACLQKGGDARKAPFVALVPRRTAAQHPADGGQPLAAVIGKEIGHRGHGKEFFRRAVDLSRQTLLPSAAERTGEIQPVFERTDGERGALPRAGVDLGDRGLDDDLQLPEARDLPVRDDGGILRGARQSVEPRCKEHFDARETALGGVPHKDGVDRLRDHGDLHGLQPALQKSGKFTHRHRPVRDGHHLGEYAFEGGKFQEGALRPLETALELFGNVLRTDELCKFSHALRIEDAFAARREQRKDREHAAAAGDKFFTVEALHRLSRLDLPPHRAAVSSEFQQIIAVFVPVPEIDGRSDGIRFGGQRAVRGGVEHVEHEPRKGVLGKGAPDIGEVGDAVCRKHPLRQGKTLLPGNEHGDIAKPQPVLGDMPADERGDGGELLLLVEHGKGAHPFGRHGRLREIFGRVQT